MFKKFRKTIYNTLTAISFPVKALNNLNKAHYESSCTLVNECMPYGSKNLVKPQKENQNFIKNYKNPEPKPKKTRAIP